MPETVSLPRRVLIVEDDYFLAQDLKAEFESAGIDVVGPVRRVRDALAMVERGERIDGAVLDVNLAGEMVYPVADALRARGVPFVFVTGYDATFIPSAYADVPRSEKPVDSARVARSLFGPRPGG